MSEWRIHAYDPGKSDHQREFETKLKNKLIRACGLPMSVCFHGANCANGAGCTAVPENAKKAKERRKKCQSRQNR